jgi:four helix bundle protein
MREERVVNYEEWQADVPATIKNDTLWKMEAYRIALFVADIGWFDVVKLAQDRRMLSLSDQLYRSLGSISANIAEGYSRGSAKDRTRFYEYSLGSARESRDWYYKARHSLTDVIISHRIQLITQVIRLLLTTIPQQRGHTVHEESAEYNVQATLHDLLNEVPLSDT